MKIFYFIKCLFFLQILFSSILSKKSSPNCADGEYEDKNKCHPCSAGCQDCVDNKDCQGCFDGYYYSAKLCQACNNACSTCSSNTVCTSCPDGKVLVNQQCLACLSPCVTCTISTSQCLRCNDPAKQILPTCNCKNGYYINATTNLCQICQSPCLTCASPSYCLSCYNSYVLISNSCQPCTKPCQTCSINITNCSSCVDQTYQMTPTCQCQNGYMMTNSYQCAKCTFPCATCQSQVIECQTCANTYTYDSIQKKCECQTNQFEQIGTPNQCINCSSPCVTCQQTQTRCTSCDVSSHRILFNYSCVCNNGYYENGGTCTQCDPSCQACISLANNCICVLGKVKILTVCEDCQLPCATCQTTVNYCLTCIDVNQIASGGVCNCQNGYYASGFICLPCQSACTICNNLNGICTGCTDPNHIIVSNLCICKSGYIESSIDQTKCLACSYPCQECKYEINYCTSCQDLSLYHLEDSKCVCADGYFLNENQCFKCSPQCFACIDFEDNCTSCQIFQNASLFNNCFCNQGYYLNTFFQCIECQPPCYSCQNNYDFCISCISEHHTLLNNKCFCNDGFYYKIDDCEQCEQNCITCSDWDQCTQCKNQFYLYVGICYPCNLPCKDCLDQFTCLNCVKGHQLTIDNICIKCAENCYLCQNDTECSICDDGYFLFESSCQVCSENCQTCELKFDNCVYCRDLYMIDNENKCYCPDGYYEYNKGCLECEYPCIKCLSKDNCINCATMNHVSLINSTNQCQCDAGYFWKLNECLICDEKCLTCSQSYDLCNKCDPQKLRILSSNKCICENNYYEDLNKNCIACSSNEGKINPNCHYIDCNDFVWTYGEECDDGNNIVKDGCTNCKIDQNFICVNKILQQSLCYQCPFNCAQCMLDETLNKVNCDICQSGFYLDSDFSCYKCAAQCLECLYLPKNCTKCRYKSENPNKCILCDENKGYYSNQDSTKCISDCGDQIQTQEEECDDGNLILGDGCDNLCRIEPKFICKDSICITPEYPKPNINPRGDQSAYFSDRKFELSYEQEIQTNNNFSIKNNVILLIKKGFDERIIDYDYNLQENNTEGKFNSTNYHLYITLKMNKSSKNENLIIRFQNIIQIKSMLGYSQKDTFVHAKIAPFTIISEDTKNQVTAVSNGNSYILYIIAAMAGGALLFGGIDIFYNLLDSLQMLSYFKYVNTQFPYNLDVFFKLFGFAQLNFIQQYFDFEMLLGSNADQQDSSVPQKIANDGINEFFIINASSVFTVWLSLFGVYFLSILIEKNLTMLQFSFNGQASLGDNYKIKIQLYYLALKNYILKIAKSVTSEFFYSGLIRAHISTAYDYSFGTVLQLYALNKQSQHFVKSLSSFLAVISLVAYSLIMYLVLPLQDLKKFEIKTNQNEKKFGSLFEGLKMTQSAKYFNTIQLFKKFIFMVILIFPYNAPLFQILSLIVLSSVINFYIILFKPLQDYFESKKQTIIEISTLILLVLMSIFVLDDHFTYLTYEIRQDIGWACIITITIMLVVQIIIDAIQQWILLINKFKKLKNLFLKFARFLGYDKAKASNNILVPCQDGIILYD